MSTVLKPKQAFGIKSKHDAFYTGGNIEWLDNKLFCQTTSSINILDIETASTIAKIGDDEENEAVIQTFVVNKEIVITSHKSGLLKLWGLDGIVLRMWKYVHQGPITKLALKHQKLASGGSDGVIRLWDLDQEVCLFCLRPIQGVVNVIEFHPSDKWIFGSGDDGNINMWNIENGELCRKYSAHYSKVTSLCFHYDNKHFITAGRDKVLVLWHIDHDSALNIIPVYEIIESIISIPKYFDLPHKKSTGAHDIFIATGGSQGIVGIWNVTKCKQVYKQENLPTHETTEENGLAITKLLFNLGLRIFIVVNQQQNLMIYNLNTFRCIKQLIGFSDEILDITYVGKGDTHLAVASNSSDIKLYEDSTMNCQLLKGHSDIVLALNKCPSKSELMISSSKDNSIRLWLMQGNIMVCIGIGMRHVNSVGAVTFGQSKFIVSASQDMCIKVWQVPDKFESNSNLYCLRTEIAHQKDVNTIAVAPNNRMIATGSQDKTLKLWSESLELLGTLRGHKRGVCCAKFSPVDQNLLRMLGPKVDICRLDRSVSNIQCSLPSLLTMLPFPLCDPYAENMPLLDVFRSVKAVWNNYPALYAHISQNRDATATGLKRKLEPALFLQELGLFYDILCELGIISCMFKMESLKSVVGRMRQRLLNDPTNNTILEDLRVVLSSSADATIKLWSIADLSCLKTFETHEASILRIEFITNGMQFISTGTDGLVKLFNLKTSECICTLNQHKGQIWALALKQDERQFITGGTDSLFVKWQDITEEKIASELKKQDEYVLQEQLLQNYLQNDQSLKGLKFALKLDKPLHVLKIIRNILKKGELGLNTIIAELSYDQKYQLLQVVIKWNTSSKYFQVAQGVLNVVLNELTTSSSKTLVGNTLEEIIPYTERHFNRLTQLTQYLCFITYTINCMQPHARIN